jgi:hypothetical protein
MHLLGPCVWGLLDEGLSRAMRSPAPFSLAGALAAMCEALREVLPCVHCRASYELYCARSPPPRSLSPLAEWIHAAHSGVNRKLARANLPFAQWISRLAAYPEMLSPSRIAHALALLSLNLPWDARARTPGAPPSRRALVGAAFEAFYGAAALLFPDVLPTPLPAAAFGSRDALGDALRKGLPPAPRAALELALASGGLYYARAEPPPPFTLTAAAWSGTQV